MSKEQRQEVLSVYLSSGYEAAKPLAIKYGVNPHYIAELARRRNFKGNHKRRWRLDPRWERAKVIGEIHI